MLKIYEPVVKYRIKKKIKEPIKITSPKEVFEKILKKEFDPGREHFWVIFFNSSNEKLCIQKLFSGTINETNVWCREIIRTALFNNAVSIIIAHNHPSSGLEPSNIDITTTEKIQDACKIFEIRLLDHIIFSGDSFISLKEKGYV